MGAAAEPVVLGESTAAKAQAEGEQEQKAVSLAKRQRTKAPDGKVYFSYAQIHSTVASMKDRLLAWKPDVMVAIGGGGFIPARMLRTEVRVPILAVSLELYDDVTDAANKQVVVKQWFDETSGVGSMVRGRRVVIVDEVDDTRLTLEYCVRELQRQNAPAAVAVAVVHNKLKTKQGTLPEGVAYFAGEDVEDVWNCYPWEASHYGHSIEEHEELARQCSLSLREA